MHSLLIIVNNAIGFKAKLHYIKYSHYKKRNNYEIEVLTKGGNHIAICKCIKSTTWTLLKYTMLYVNCIFSELDLFIYPTVVKWKKL